MNRTFFTTLIAATVFATLSWLPDARAKGIEPLMKSEAGATAIYAKGIEPLMDL